MFFAGTKKMTNLVCKVKPQVLVAIFIESNITVHVMLVAITWPVSNNIMLIINIEPPNRWANNESTITFTH